MHVQMRHAFARVGRTVFHNVVARLLDAELFRGAAWIFTKPHCEALNSPGPAADFADLVRRARVTLDKKISRSTVWRMLHEAAIKPWQHEHWIFPRDPRFAEKAGPILDLYAGTWEGKPLGPKDYVLSLDEKTSIQARRRRHKEMPPAPKQIRNNPSARRGDAFHAASQGQPGQ